MQCLNHLALAGLSRHTVHIIFPLVIMNSFWSMCRYICIITEHCGNVLFVCFLATSLACGSSHARYLLISILQTKGQVIISHLKISWCSHLWISAWNPHIIRDEGWEVCSSHWITEDLRFHCAPGATPAHWRSHVCHFT